jgi:ribonuclease-3
MPADAELESALGYAFRDPSLLALSLAHPSLTHEAGGGQKHNQRLEFLGDAVIQLVVTAELYARFPGLGEGALTKARARMVNRTSLAGRGRHLRLGEHIVLSRGEEASGGRQRGSTVADAFEAVIGAVFLDGGFGAARDLVLRLFREDVGELAVLPSLDNPKGELQELLQSTSPEAPHYEMLRSEGPDHDRTFECSVSHLGRELARGVGRSKKAAESQAALLALRALRPASAGGTRP